MISDRELEAIRARADAATEGPLTCGRIDEETDTCVIGNKGLFWLRVVGGPDRPAAPDAMLFAHAQNDIRRLLDEIARLKDLPTMDFDPAAKAKRKETA